MTPLADKLPLACRADAECRLLVELRDRPDLMAAVAAAAGSELSVQQNLRKRFPEELVRHALLLHDLRRPAAGKFSRAERMWFDRVGLEQATAELVARHKAARFPAGEKVWDLCSGIGSDAVALAGRGPVIAVDNRPASCLRTLWNSEVYGVAEAVELRCEDAESIVVSNDFVHIDPDRRSTGSQRANRLEEYHPGLEYLQRLAETCRGGAIKVGPASNFGGKFPRTEIELVSLHGECKEATVWFGELAGPHPCRATVLPAGAALAGHPLSSSADITPLQSFLFDPDPAVVRSGLVDLCAKELSLNRLDAAEEYLTGDRPVESPFVTPFRVLAELPNNERELRRFLRTANGGRYEIKCRHVPVHAEELRRRLPHDGDRPLTIFLARLAGKARFVVAERV
jgi:hypothetical protein